MKTQLTAEQSANLISKGVSANRASEIEEYNDPVSQWTHRGQPVFTLADLLEILPKDITAEDGEEYYFICGASYPSGDWGAAYTPKWFDGDNIGSKAAPELIDSLYELIIFCIDNNYLNKE